MNNLQRVDVDIIDRNVCTRPDSNGAVVQENMLCAGNMKGGRDACQVIFARHYDCRHVSNEMYHII